MDIDWANVTKVYKGYDVVEKVYAGYNDVYHDEPTPPTPVVDYTIPLYVENISDETGTLNWTRNTGSDFEYSFDNTVWTEYTEDIDIPAGSKCYLRCNRGEGDASLGAYRLTFDKAHNLGGNILSVMDKVNYATMTEITYTNWNFRQMFSSNTNLVSAGEMNFGKITTFAGPNALFQTFNGCTNLVTPPNTSNFTSVSNRMFQDTFKGCSSLTTAPDFSHITGKVAEYSISGTFENCTSLITGADLSNITSATNRGLYRTYTGCTSLQTVYAPNISSWGNITTNWMTNVAVQGTMYFASNESMNACPSGVNGCPTTWTKRLIS